MEIKRFILPIMVFSLLFMSACSKQPAQKDMGELYGLALEAYMPIDEGLNTNMGISPLI